MPAKTDQLSVFPIFMKVEDRVAVVVGNGAEALAKARLLRESRVGVRLVAPLASRELGAFIIQADLDRAMAPFAPSMLDGAVMVFAATGNGDEDAAIVDAARARNIPVNAVDRPELCDFYVPALVNRAPVAVAVGSEGTGPVLTQMIRSRVEALLPRSTGQLARLAGRYRAIVKHLVPEGAARRRFWRAFFEGEVARCVEAGNLAEARRHATRMLKAPAAEAGFVSIVGAGPGSQDLLTLRGQRALQEADVIVHDGSIVDALAALGRRDARRFVAEGKEGAARAVAEAEAGNRIAWLVSGDPRASKSVSGAVGSMREAGIAFDIVPGIPADTPDQTNVRSSRKQAAAQAA